MNLEEVQRTGQLGPLIPETGNQFKFSEIDIEVLWNGFKSSNLDMPPPALSSEGWIRDVSVHNSYPTEKNIRCFHVFLAVFALAGVITATTCFGIKAHALYQAGQSGKGFALGAVFTGTMGLFISCHGLAIACNRLWDHENKIDLYDSVSRNQAAEKLFKPHNEKLLLKNLIDRANTQKERVYFVCGDAYLRHYSFLEILIDVETDDNKKLQYIRIHNLFKSYKDTMHKMELQISNVRYAFHSKSFELSGSSEIAPQLVTKFAEAMQKTQQQTLDLSGRFQAEFERIIG